MAPAVVALALAGVLHAGFQVTVTLLVYPALAEVAPQGWVAAHARHSRRIVALVGVVYAALLVTGAWVVLAGEADSWLVVLALVGAAGALGLTAGGAAPVHGRLGTHDPHLLTVLLRVDRWRCGFAVLGAVAGVLALL